MIKGNHFFKRALSKQHGMLLPVAVFLLVVLSAMGAFALRMSVLTNATISQDILSVQAFMAGKAANDWVSYQVYQPDAVGAPVMQACPATTSLNINGFNVQINCSAQTFQDEVIEEVRVYRVVSTASKGTVGTANYIERQVTATLSRCIRTDAAGLKTECN